MVCVSLAQSLGCFLKGGFYLFGLEEIARDRQYFAAAIHEIGFGAR
jgi:hypothetical protein